MKNVSRTAPELCDFDDTDKVTLVNKKNYEMVIRSRLNLLRTRPVNCVRDTCARLTLLRENMVEPNGMNAFSFWEKLPLQYGTNQAVVAFGIMMILVCRRESGVLVVSGVVENLAVYVLLGTYFIDTFVRVIFPAKKKTVPYNSLPVQILIVHEASGDNRATTKSANVSDGSELVITKSRELFIPCVDSRLPRSCNLYWQSGDSGFNNCRYPTTSRPDSLEVSTVVLRIV